jgi:endoglucanase Acf2
MNVNVFQRFVPWSRCWLLCLGLMAALAALAQDVVAVGAGGWRAQPSRSDNPVPQAPYRTQEMLRRAAPTNQWYSSVMFTRWSEVLHAVPLSAKATPHGLEVGYPQKSIVPTDRRDVEVIYRHTPDLILKPHAFQPEAALLSGHSEWAVDIAFQSGDQSMTTTVAHGSPFVFARLSHGDLVLNLGPSMQAQVWSVDSRVLRVQGEGKLYAAFSPTGGRWIAPAEGRGWRLSLPSERRYVAAALLPDDTEATLRLFLANAYSHIVDTRAEFEFRRQAGEVVTQFRQITYTHEGAPGAGLMGLYPHHWHQNPTLMATPVARFASIRGDIRLYEGREFQTRYRHHGFVPHWPALTDANDGQALRAQLRKEAGRARRMMLEIGQGPYWQGKGLQRISQLMVVADVQGEKAIRDELLQLLKGRAEQWLSGQSSRTYFHYSPKLGTVVSYPEEYDAVKDMNDHHFHYGYWIRAAADIGLRDPQWIRPERWGGMINLLVADVATAERGRSDFPYLRNFDAYEGHSWASGVALSPDGNNQESSSEATNAWAALMMWGTLQGRPDWVDLGAYLYNTEIQAIQHYWFDVHGLTLPKEYLNVEVSMLFGGKLAHNTWWIDEPRQIHGINLLPLTTSSTYLGASPEFVHKNMAALERETNIYHARAKRAKPEDIWQDLFAKYVALVDPARGRARWNEWGTIELGDTRSHALHWLSFLQQAGPVNLSIWADAPFHAVFGRGAEKSYLVYNPEPQLRTVTFSDGKVVQAPAGQVSVH